MTIKEFAEKTNINYETLRANIIVLKKGLKI